MKIVSIKKKVLFVITKSNWGGAQRYVYDLASTLSKGEYAHNYEVSVAVGGRGELFKKLQEVEIGVYNIASLERDVRIIKDFNSLRELSSIIARVRPDIVHLNSSKIGLLGALATRFVSVRTGRKIKVIFTAHGWAFNEQRGMLGKIILKFLYWIIIMLSDKIIAVSYAAKSQAALWPFAEKKISVVHNGVSEIDFLTRENARRAFGITNVNTWVLGTIAELHRIKGLSYAIQAVKKILIKEKDASYIIIGEGEERSRLEQLINTSSLQDHVRLAGYLPHAARYLKAFDAFLFPSLSEGLGYVVLEAGLAALPVIASSVGGIPEIIESKQYGFLIPPQNSNAIVQRVLEIKTETQQAKKIGALLRDRVINHFSIARMVEKTLNLYQ